MSSNRPSYTVTANRSTWIERLARLGYITKGFVYGLIGVLALMAAFGLGGQTTDTTGALQTIATQPFGQFLLVLITIGLIGYALWRWIECIQDPEHKGSDAKGIFSRLGYAISGLIYAGLALTSARLVMGAATGGGNSQQDWTAFVLAQPWGNWLVATLGAFIIGLGFYMFYKAYKTKFTQELDLRNLEPKKQNLLINICRLGIFARGIVFVIIGFFLIQAARFTNPNEVKGIDGALQTLKQQPFGKFLLTLVALGLVAYGIYMAVKAIYKRIEVD
ncbi:DUF1206 domain-containing protein [Planktothrix pseudagardhii]|uniref:DUF1206 domain-containing protein n=1 Tax=Planktothrix pseudagardhii TaxID=132604 RepID=A0A9W4D929_9CYAN|nr:DUF1206 domain-containing protein [Planktothrix pseudagardhii]CAD5964579.1 hypothetical protein NO713_03417 [Planktothrix pseudagardhii]